MNYELLEITNKPSSYSEEETAIIGAMQHTLLSLLEEFLAKNPVLQFEEGLSTSDLALISATMGVCETSVSLSLSFINTNHPDLFENVFVHKIDHNPLFIDHYMLVLKGKSGKYYYTSPANYYPPEELETIGSYNRLGHFAKADSFEGIMQAIKEYET